MICFDENTLIKRSFSSARILIETCLRFFIKGWVSLSLGEIGCKVFVKEICYDSLGSTAPKCLCFEKEDLPGCLCTSDRIEGDGQKLNHDIELEHEKSDDQSNGLGPLGSHVLHEVGLVALLGVELMRFFFK